ncbi:porin [Loktanella agnita]|uniref:porin n=1 Tax=Loktanella agnita TaxID=287097 RepID=UPI00398A1347
MKSILLTTTALVAFASAAAADGHASISFSGNTEIGFNDTNINVLPTDDNDSEDGFYWNTDIDVTMTAELDNGLTASTSFEIDVVGDPANSATLSSDEWVTSIEGEGFGVFIGDTEFAAITRWASAGDMEADSFSEADGENVIRADADIAGFGVSVSAVITDAAQVYVSDTNGENVDQMSAGIAGDLGMFSFALAYQEEASATFAPVAAAANGDYVANEVLGVSAGVSVAGADITVAFAERTGIAPEEDATSIGAQVAYPFGPVTVTGYFVAEEGTDGTEEDPNFGIAVAYADGPIAVDLDFDDDQGTTKIGLDGSYDVGNGLTVLAGYYTQDNEDGSDYADEFYVAGTYDLGGGAELLVSYAEGDDNTDDEIGGPDYQIGTTVEVSFAF